MAIGALAHLGPLTEPAGVPHFAGWAVRLFDRSRPFCFGDQAPHAQCRQTGSVLESTPDLEPDRADLDGEHPIALVQDVDQMLKCLFGLPGRAQDRD